MFSNFSTNFATSTTERLNMSQANEKTIDIDKILRGKMGAKAKYVPGFLVRLLKRIAHQDQVNAFLWESRDKLGTEWLEECVRYLDMTLEIRGQENLPSPNDGRLYTFVSNHPLGGEDGVALGAIIGRHYDSRFRYLVNDLLMNLPGLAPLCIPINTTGAKSRNFPAMVEAGFQSDNHMLMFPAGLGAKPSYRRALNISATWCPSTSAGATATSFTGWPTSAIGSCRSIWRCCFLSMKCIKTYIRSSPLPSGNPSLGRPSIRQKHRWNGQNL